MVLVMFGMAVQTQAQKLLSEGTIQYDVSVQTGTNDPKMADVFDGATALVLIKGSHSRSELKSAIGSSITLYDSRTGNGVIMREFGAQKLLIRMNRQNWIDRNKNTMASYLPKPARRKRLQDTIVNRPSENWLMAQASLCSILQKSGWRTGIMMPNLKIFPVFRWSLNQRFPTSRSGTRQAGSALIRFRSNDLKSPHLVTGK